MTDTTTTTDTTEPLALGTRIRYTPPPAQLRRGFLPVVGEIIDASPLEFGGYRYRVRTAERMPRGDGFIEWHVYTRPGTVEVLED